MPEVELDAVRIIGGALAFFIAGAIWYAPQVMGNRWLELIGKPMDELGSPQQGMMASGVAALVISVVMAHVVAYSLYFTDASGWQAGAEVGLWMWLGFIATDVGIYGFEGRNWKLWPIDKLWMLFGLLAMGAIIAY